MWLEKLFTRHPASVGETYGEHLVVAGGFGVRLVLAGVACLLHALLPFLFENTASRAITELNARMLARRRLAQTSALAHPSTRAVHGDLSHR
jgi:hypothetical protein